MVSGEPDLLQVHFFLVLRVDVEQRGLELEAALVDCDGVSDMSRCRTSNVAVGFAEERNLKFANTVDAVEESQEMDTDIRTAERRFELCHVSMQFAVLISLGHVPSGVLVFAVCVPSKGDHFFVSAREESDVVDHFGEESRRVCTA